MPAPHRSLLLALPLALLAGAACKDKAQASPPPTADTAGKRGVPGSLCKANSECIKGSFCLYGVCEFPGPCSATGHNERGQTAVSVFAYNKDNRQTQARYYEGGKLQRTQHSVWSDDGRNETWTLVMGDENKTTVTGQLIYGANGWPTTTTDVDADGGTRTTTWSMRTECLVGESITKDAKGNIVSRSKAECRDGKPTQSLQYSIRDGKETLVRTKRYHYDRAVMGGQHLHRMSFAYHDADLPETHITFVRNDKGAQVGQESRTSGDTPSIQVEHWDLSCWKVTADGITGGPKPLSASEDLPEVPARPTLQAGALAKDIKGRWTIAGKDSHVVIDLDKGVWGMAEKGGYEEHSVRIVAQDADSIVAVLKPLKDEITVRLERVDDKTLKVRLGDKNLLLIRPTK